jgi:hypothetical protein
VVKYRILQKGILFSPARNWVIISMDCSASTPEKKRDYLYTRKHSLGFREGPVQVKWEPNQVTAEYKDIFNHREYSMLFKYNLQSESWILEGKPSKEMK